MVIKNHIQPAADGAEVGKADGYILRRTYRERLKRCGTRLEVQEDLMRHANVKVTAEAYGLDRNLLPGYCKAATTVVKTLLGE